MCVNPNQLKTGRLEINLRFFGKCWLTNLKILFPDGDDEGAFIVPALDARSQILSIKDRRNGVGKPFFKLAPLEADKDLPLLHLTCVFLVFLVNCCNGSSLKPVRPMCDGRPLASPLFRRLAGRGAPFCGFPFRWVVHFVFCDSVIMHDETPYSREDFLFECGRPCDTMSLLFFTALWLQRSQSFWCRRPSQRRISISLASRRSRSKLPHAYK